MIDCYVINLDSAKERWDSVVRSPGLSSLNIIRVPAVIGKEIPLPHPEFSPRSYFFFYGRKPSPGAIGCYFSHLKTLRAFLASGKEYAIIAEDDIDAPPELPELLNEILRYSDSWDLVRLVGFRQKNSIPFADLGKGYKLVSELENSTSSACYLINRRAAERVLRKLVPMWTNFDIALFHGPPIGIREVAVCPYPVRLTELSFQSNIGYETKGRYPIFHPAIFRFALLIPHRFLTRGWRLAHRLRTAIGRWLFPPIPRGD